LIQLISWKGPHHSSTFSRNIPILEDQSRSAGSPNSEGSVSTLGGATQRHQIAHASLSKFRGRLANKNSFLWFLCSCNILTTFKIHCFDQKSRWPIEEAVWLTVATVFSSLDSLRSAFSRPVLQASNTPAKVCFINRLRPQDFNPPGSFSTRTLARQLPYPRWGSGRLNGGSLDKSRVSIAEDLKGALIHD
jgi:hypothetical protein